MTQAKRVILRLSESDLDERGSNEIFRLYLSKTGHSLQGLEENHHFIHIQPSNSHIPQANPTIHIVIDLEKNQFSGSIGDDFPHEFYRVRRHNGELALAKYQETPWFENYKKKVREVTDKSYLWGGKDSKFAS
ncbi:hypothetical protein N7540_004547 [Penicillium herquei]|nr:hypothetical protein N7540_004547 [Penicillium herquei]